MIHQYLYSEKTDNIYFDTIKNPRVDTAIIFIHGFMGSRKSWGNLYNDLSSDYSLYFIDLLGFGFSAKPNSNYTLEKHIAAVKKFIDKEVKEKNVILVGHSLGSIVALGYIAAYPDSIKKTILLTLPYYYSSEEAKKHLSASTKYPFILEKSFAVEVLCLFMCSVFGSITRKVAPLLMRDLPKDVVQDIYRHSYQSFISTLFHVIYEQDLIQLFTPEVKKKVVLVHGTNDKTVPIKNVQDLAKKLNLSLQTLPNATHLFPLYNSAPVIQFIRKKIE